MMGLTPPQADALNAIRKLSRGGVGPSFEEMKVELGVASRSYAFRLVHALKERGMVTFIPNKSRSIRIVGEIEGLKQRSTDDLQALRRNIDAILRGRADA